MAKNRDRRTEDAAELVELTKLDTARLKSVDVSIAEVDRQLAMQRAARVEPLERRRRGYVIQLADRLGVPEAAIGEIDIEAGIASVDRGEIEAAKQRAESQQAALVAAE